MEQAGSVAPVGQTGDRVDKYYRELYDIVRERLGGDDEDAGYLLADFEDAVAQKVLDNLIIGFSWPGSQGVHPVETWRQTRPSERDPIREDRAHRAQLSRQLLDLLLPSGTLEDWDSVQRALDESYMKEAGLAAQ